LVTTDLKQSNYQNNSQNNYWSKNRCLLAILPLQNESLAITIKYI
jgi:hypothetical protein